MTLTAEELRQVKKSLPPIPSMIGMLHDVDVSSTPPADGDAFIWDGTAKRWVPGSAGGGFDPNEDPVIIGSGATAGGGSAPGSPSGGFSGNVAIGNSAAATGNQFAIAVGEGALADDYGAIAIGHSAHGKLSGIAIGEAAYAFDTVDGHDIAIGDSAVVADGGGNSIALGPDASVDGPSSIAIGNDATVSNASDSSVAIGHTAAAAANGAVAIGANSCTASGLRSIAIGYGASAAYDYSVAIGRNCFPTAAHQIMLGSSADTVYMFNFDASGLPTSDPGISGLVWNSGGALVVSP